MTSNIPLGSVIQGSLTEGLEVRLHPDISVEDMRVGKFIVVQGLTAKFFCLVTDVILGTSNPRILVNPPHPGDSFLREVLAGSSTYGTIQLSPMLMLKPPKEDDNPEQELELLPVKTIPSHFSQVYDAQEQDFGVVFGWEDAVGKKNFAIGQPLDMDIDVCIDLNRWVERSNGIFGKSGTGKSFLTRLIISGTIRKQAAVNLIFDMHSEYGWQAVSEGKGGTFVKGLKQLFGSAIEIYTLDPESTRRRGVNDAKELYLGFNQIELEDLRLVSQELGLSEAALDNANILRSEYGEYWIGHLSTMSNDQIKEFCAEKQGHAGSIMSLQRKLMRLESLKYISNIARGHNYIEEILQMLEAGKHVIIEFGSQSNMLSYMLAANMISRRIHQAYVKRAEQYLQTGNPGDRPRPLVITIEEAHRFLDPSIVHQTIFGTIAREMRKYFVTLLVVDQRPSGIDHEVMSQVGTRVTCLMNDEKDIEAIFTGVSGAGGLRSVLSKLDSRQQALVLGHAVPMPVVVRTRPYDSKFYAEIGNTNWQEESDEELFRTAQANLADIGF